MPFTPLYFEFGALADAEVPAIGPAGSLLVYRTDILHRGSNFTGARALALLDARRLPGAGNDVGREDGVAEAVARTLGEAHAAVHASANATSSASRGPATPYWNEQTLTDVAARYPGIDMTPYGGEPLTG